MAFAAAWMPEERILVAKDKHMVTYVSFPRVEITGKRE
jgi:hypothetical protein